MDSIKKIHIILRESGLSQEALAREFSVSFATVNSWINGRSVPRKGAQELIEKLYLKYTAQNIISASDIKLQYNKILEHKNQYKHILNYILSNKDIYDQFLLSLTYNTNKIEGSTLTEAETAEVLFHNVNLSDKDLVELMEVKNHQAALEYLFSYINNGGCIDREFILHLHAMLMNGIRHDAGLYRSHAVRIVGANVATANYVKVPMLMEDLIEEINDITENAIEHASVIHSKFEKIHPFSDGNGRVGRLLMNAMLLKSGFAPALIKDVDRKFYLKYLNKSQKSDDHSLLSLFVHDAVLDSYKIVNRKLS